MLFNSVSFICLFLPVTLALFFICGRLHQRLAMALLVLCSIVFYSWLGAEFLPLLLVSILFNCALGYALERAASNERLASSLLVFGVSANLLVLVYYKYLYDLTGWAHIHGLFPATPLGSAVLPLGISFFTFTQIGFLIDRKAGVTKASHPIEYLLFVTFFPHLIAGPILHHREIMPQFLAPATYRPQARNLAVGLSIFTVGLAKKVLIADWFGAFVPLAFDQHHDLQRIETWRCVLSYFIQLYFDFSGYSEMALGLARMFNVTFPANFDSPYKAPNVIEFWQRWHMSLTRFLNLYVYNPIALAITRARYAKGKPANAAALKTLDGFTAMVAMPTVITLTLIGVWHGSGLQFLVFGVLHALYLCIAHGWRQFVVKKTAKSKPGRFGAMPAIVLTCLAVLFAQVFFRAPSLADALHVIHGLVFGSAAPDVVAPYSTLLPGLHLPNLRYWAAIFAALAFVWTMPNTLQLFSTESPALAKSRAQKPLIAFAWRPSASWGVAMGLLFLYAFLCVTGTSEFLYFRF